MEVVACVSIGPAQGEGSFRAKAYTKMGPPPDSSEALALSMLPALPEQRIRDLSRNFFSSVSPAPTALAQEYANWLLKDPNHPDQLNEVGRFVESRLRERTDKRESANIGIWIEDHDSIEFKYGWFPIELVSHAHPFDSGIGLRFVRIAETRSPVDTVRRLSVVEKIRVLFVYANPAPNGTTASGVDDYTDGRQWGHVEGLEGQFESIVSSVEEISGQREVWVERSVNEPARRVLDRIAESNPHVLVFAGHGYSEGAGAIICSDDGRPDPLHFPELQDTLNTIDNPHLALAVLVACQSYAAAPLLIQCGVPSVVAMQSLFTDPSQGQFPADSAEAFGCKFFEKAWKREPIHVAHQAGVDALSGPAAVMPTLWLASENDEIFGDRNRRVLKRYLDALRKRVRERAYLSAPLPDGADILNLRSPKGVAEGELLVSESGEVHSLKDVVAQYRRVRIEGPPWVGKTTLCRSVVDSSGDLLRQTHGNDDRNDPLPPIFLHHPEVVPARSLEEYIRNDYLDPLGVADEVIVDDGKEEPLGAWLLKQWREGRLLLILDSIVEHELPGIIGALEAEPNAQVLLASRELDVPELAGTERFFLRDWSEEHVRRYVERIEEDELEGKARERALARIVGDAPLARLLRRPGHLVQMLLLDDRLGDADDNAIATAIAQRRVTSMKGRIPSVVEADEDDWKYELIRLVLDSLKGHGDTSTLVEDDLVGIIRDCSSQVKFRGQPVYEPDDAEPLLEDLSTNSAFLRRNGKAFVLDSSAWLEVALETVQ